MTGEGRVGLGGSHGEGIDEVGITNKRVVSRRNKSSLRQKPLGKNREKGLGGVRRA